MAKPLPWGLERQKKRGPWASIIILVLVLVTFGVVIGLLSPSLKEESDDCAAGNSAPSQFNVKLSDKSEKLYNLDYAKTPLQQEMGLSARTCIPKNSAMLFLFAGDDRYGIWMKDMRFPIDVVWLDKDKKVVTIEKNMQPSSYPKIFKPTADARYVLEFNTGAVDELQASVGSTFNW